MPQTFVFGDIHGALRAVQQLIQQINPAEEDTLIFLGDYVDGWSESAQLINYLLELNEIHQCIFLKGNHDVWCYEWLSGHLPNNDWLNSGGKATIKSYAQLSEETLALHQDFYASLRDYYIDSNNRLFIHAGFTSMHGPTRERHASAFYWDRSLWEVALAVDQSIPPTHSYYPKRLKLFKEIYIGHTPTTNYAISTPMHKCNVWNMDTGAAFKGALSAINIDSKEIFQSAVVTSLYPHESGRN